MRGDRVSLTPGLLLDKKTVGIVGLGRIGYRVAEILDALGCRIVFYDPFTTMDPHEDWVRSKTLEELVRQSDIITLHAVSQMDNKPLFNADEFSKCKKGVIIINTARGTLIDERALVLALENGTVSSAGLDVFSTEPYKGPLLSFSQVIVTPHVASNTIESRRIMEREAFTNLLPVAGD